MFNQTVRRFNDMAHEYQALKDRQQLPGLDVSERLRLIGEERRVWGLLNRLYRVLKYRYGVGVDGDRMTMEEALRAAGVR